MSIEQTQLKELRREIAYAIVSELRRPWMGLSRPAEVEIDPVDVPAAFQKLCRDKLAGRISGEEFESGSLALNVSHSQLCARLTVNNPAIFWAWYRSLTRYVAQGLRCQDDRVAEALEMTLVPCSHAYEAQLRLRYRSPFDMEVLFKAMQLSLRRFPI